MPQTSTFAASSTPDLSVVMPVKDTLEYLPISVESALSQDGAKLELICVDDGSTDGSVEWLTARAASDDRLVVIVADPHRSGPGAARNRALEVAQGDFVGFLDSDDLFIPGSLQKLLATAQSQGADVTMGGIHKFSDAGSKERFWPCTYLELLPRRVGTRGFTWHEIADILFDLRFVCWNKIFRRTFLDQHQIRFPEGIFYEDLPFYVQTTLAARSMAFLDAEVVSNRRFREGATTFSQGGRAFDAIEAMELTRAHLEALDDQAHPGSRRELLRDFEVFRFRRLLEYLHKNDANHLPQFYDVLKSSAASLDDGQVQSLPEPLQHARDRIVSSSAVEFLAFDAWEARTTAARLAREKRALRAKNRKLKKRLASAALTHVSGRSLLGEVVRRAVRRFRAAPRGIRQMLGARRDR